MLIPPFALGMSEALQILVSLPQCFKRFWNRSSELNYCPIGHPEREFIFVFE